MNQTELALYKQIREQISRLTDLFERLVVNEDVDHALDCLVNLVMDDYFKQEMYQTISLIAAKHGYVRISENTFNFRKEEEE